MADDDYQTIFEVNPRPMWVFDRDTLEILAVNEAACEFYGYTREEMLAMTVRSLRASTELPRFEYALAASRARPEDSKLGWTTEHMRKDGTRLDVDIAMRRVTFRGRSCTLGTATTLTPAALAEHRFRRLLEHSADGIVLVDDHGTVAYLSPGGERIIGRSAADVVGKSITNFLNVDDMAGVAYPGPGESVVHIARAQHGDGTWRWLEAKITNMFLDPAIRARVTNFRDITERHTFEESLRQSEANFRALIERTPTIVLVQRHGKIIYVNPATVAALGYASMDEIVGRDVIAFLHPEDRERVSGRMINTAVTGRSPVSECRFLRRDGSPLVVEAEALLLTFDGQPSNVVLGRDITERRDMFARIAVAERMMSVGTLAAGIAHEINNPLAYVISNLAILTRELPLLVQGSPGGRAGIDPTQVRGLIADAHEGALRVSSIVRDLRALSRTDDETCSAVDIADVLATSVKMAHNEIRHRALVVRTLHEPLPRVFANAVKLGQVFLNLLINAVQAIPEDAGGPQEIRLRAFTSADHARVVTEVEDTGMGIPDDVIGRIFDPFFTTKPIGVGTGLGLAICHQIVRSFGGEISVTSTPGRGTTVRVELPIAAAQAAGAESAPVSERPTAPPSRVLMIDDEPSVGRSSQILLAPDHDVHPVTRAKEALARLAAGETFDVILCDLMMPEMSGIEFHQHLADIAPHYLDRVVFMTGGAFTDQARRFLEGRPATLDKPFTEDELRRVIERTRR